MTPIYLFTWVATLVLLPLIVLWWATESKPQRIRRFHCQYGWSQRPIAEHLSITFWQVRTPLAEVRPSAQAHTMFCRPPLHAYMAIALNQKVLITSVTPRISTSQLPSLTKDLRESRFSSFGLCFIG